MEKQLLPHPRGTRAHRRPLLSAVVAAMALLLIPCSGRAADRPSPAVEWVKQYGLPKSYWGDYGGVAFSGSEGVCTAGYSGGTVLVARYNSRGEKEWQSEVETGNDHWPCAVTADRYGNVYLVATTATDLRDRNGMPYYGTLLVKFDAIGTEKWRVLTATKFHNFGYAVTTDLRGNIYVAGNAWGNIDGTGYGGESDAFFMKYDPSGRKQWTKRFGSPGCEFVYAITVDDEGSVYLAGETGGDLYIHTNAGEDDAFVIKYDARGARKWVDEFGTPGMDQARCLSLVKDTLYVGGALGGDAFLAQYDTAGRRRWQRLLGSGDCQGVAGDDGGVFATGFTRGCMDGNMHWGDTDLFVTRYSRSGRRWWTRQLGTARSDEGTGIATDTHGSIYVSGNTYLSLETEQTPDFPVRAGGGGLLMMKLAPEK